MRTPGPQSHTIFADNSFSIGHTPLVKLNGIWQGARATVVGKIEGPIRPTR